MAKDESFKGAQRKASAAMPVIEAAGKKMRHFMEVVDAASQWAEQRAKERV